MAYQFDSRVRYSETGVDRKLKMVSLVDYFQDCSTFQSESLGCGLDYMEANNLAWYLFAVPDSFRIIATEGTFVKGFFALFYRNSKNKRLLATQMLFCFIPRQKQQISCCLQNEQVYIKKQWGSHCDPHRGGRYDRINVFR